MAEVAINKKTAIVGADAPPVLVCTLIDQRPSDWEKEGSRAEGNPQFLSAPSQYLLPVKSVTAWLNPETEKYERRGICYISGCPTIFVDEQKKNGWERNPLNDFIVFEDGVFSVVRAGVDVAVYDYLKATYYNKEIATSHTKLFPNVTPLFEVLDMEGEAEKDMDGLEVLTKALTIASALREANAKGEMVYDNARIDELTKLLNLPKEDTIIEQMNAIVAVARLNPHYFVSAVENEDAEIKVNVAMAIEMGVLLLTADTAIHAPLNRQVFKFKGQKSDTARSEALIAFYRSKKGATEYNELLNLISQEQTNILNKGTGGEGGQN